MLASVAVPIRAGAAQLPVVVQQVADPVVAGLPIPATAPSQGMWSAVQPWPLNAISLVLMPNGKVASYGTPVNNPSVQYGMVYDVWDPTQGYGGGSHTQLSGVAGVNSFCSAQAFQPDGSLLMSGGIFDSGTDKGSAVLNSTASGITALTAKLADDRYYATMITRPDGTQLIMGGSYPYLGGAADPQGSIDKGYMTGMTPETYSPLTGWTSLFGATSRDAFGPDNNRWWYPRAWVAPNGKIFGISADRMWYLDPTGAGSVTWAPFKTPQAAASVATAAPNVGPTSTAVMYDVGKILQVGGNSYDNFWGFLASSVATTVDINGANPAVADTTPMNFGRSWANATVLPTGKVFVEGGSLFDNQAGAQAVLAPETWNPATGQWTVGPSASLYRGYHSSAVLMQDGTVLVAGGGAPGPVNNQNVEVYYPPYLFTTVNGQASLAPRPQIVSLSSNSLLYGQSMQVEVTSASALAQVVLIGLSQTTHSFNTGQRRYPMAFSQAGAIVTAQTPASGALAPPGYYQIVAIDANGVPSPGAIVAIGSSVSPPSTTAAPASPVAASLNGGSGTVGTSSSAGGGGTTGTGSSSGVVTPVSGSPTASSPGVWTSIGNNDARVAVGNDGTIVVINTSDNSVWQYVATNSWKKLPSAMKYIAVRSANSIWGIGLDSNIYRFDGSSWAFVGYNASTISVSADGMVVVTNPNNEIWYKSTDDTQNAWRKIANWAARRVAVMNNHSLWLIGTDNNIYRGDFNNNLSMLGSTAAEIATSADGTILVTSLSDQQIWRKTGDDTVNAWTPMQWKALSVAAGAAGNLYAVGLDRNTYSYAAGTSTQSTSTGTGTQSTGTGTGTSAGTGTRSTSTSAGTSTGTGTQTTGANGGSTTATPVSSAPPSTGAWTGIGTSGARVATGADGTIVMTRSYDNSVWQYVSDNNWRQLPSAMRYVAVRSASSIWGIGLDNNIYRFDGSAWTFVGYNASTISVSADGTVAVTNPSNEIWYKSTDDTQNAWTKIPNWQARRVAVMNAHSLWIVGMDNNVYRTDMYNNWANVGSAAAEIATSADGTVLVTSLNDQQIWRKTGDNSANAWTGMQWKGLSVAAGQAGRLYSVGMDHNIYRY